MTKWAALRLEARHQEWNRVLARSLLRRVMELQYGPMSEPTPDEREHRGAGRPLYVPVNRGDWPERSWECGVCKRANFPHEVRCLIDEKGQPCGSLRSERAKWIKAPADIGTRFFRPPPPKIFVDRRRTKTAKLKVRKERRARQDLRRNHKKAVGPEASRRMPRPGEPSRAAAASSRPVAAAAVAAAAVARPQSAAAAAEPSQEPQQPRQEPAPAWEDHSWMWRWSEVWGEPAPGDQGPFAGWWGSSSSTPTPWSGGWSSDSDPSDQQPAPSVAPQWAGAAAASATLTGDPRLGVIAEVVAAGTAAGAFSSSDEEELGFGYRPGSSSRGRGA